MTPNERVMAAVKLAAEFGAIDGAHHKQWVIDQMLRALLGDGYQAWREAYDVEMAAEDDEYYPPWDEGIAP